MLMRNARSPCPALLQYIHNVPEGHISMFKVKEINSDFFYYSHKHSAISWQLKGMTAYKFTVCYEHCFKWP